MQERSSSYNGVCYDNGSEPEGLPLEWENRVLALAYEIF